jgi:hypothetical protein
MYPLCIHSYSTIEVWLNPVHKYIKTYTFPTNNFVESTRPHPQAQNMQKHRFAHTFRTKIKHGQLKKEGASTVNPKKEHHHG